MALTNTTFVTKLKQDFSINVNLSDVVFTKTCIDLYNNNENRPSSFGEKLCLLYVADFTIYNIQFSIKILTFNYDSSNEVLKLDINILDKWIEKEMASCRNFLQRNRNLNLTFTVLTDFAKYIEARRLIKEIVFMKNVSLRVNKDAQGGFKIINVDGMGNLNFEANWKIEWNLKDFSVIDVIEFYYTNFENGDIIKEKMTVLTYPTLDFHNKLKAWRTLMDLINQHNKEKLVMQRLKENICDADVLVISDTEEDGNTAVSSTSGQFKRRRLDPVYCNGSAVYIVPD